jgi:hypothetical protein
MVKIERYVGRFGNQLFQYAAARMVAERNNLYLNADWPHNDILRVMPWNNDGNKINPVNRIDDEEYTNQRNCAYRDFRKTGILMNGYWQDANYYLPIRDKIKGWFEPCIYPQNHDDWCIHYRVGDYWCSRVDSVISPRWHIEILKKERAIGRKIYIVTEISDDPCVQELANAVKADIRHGSVKEDFNFVRSFDYIIGSNGSFVWWAAFLGDFKKCYMFMHHMRYHKNMYLRGVPNMCWVDGPFARNEKMRKLWDEKINNSLEGYWTDWKNKV